MPPLTLTVDRLVLLLSGFRRDPGGAPDQERLVLDMEVKNPIGSVHSVRRPPPLELRDEQDRVYPGQPDDAWASPLEPDTAIEAHPAFDIPVDATGLDVVFAPGSEDETHVALEE